MYDSVILAKLKDLLDRFNHIVETSKTIMQLPDATDGDKFFAIWNTVSGKTEKHPLSALVDQDNIPIKKFIGYVPVENEPEFTTIRAAINNQPTFTVTEKNSFVVFSATPLIFDYTAGIYTTKYILLLGKGTYGAGQAPIMPKQLEFISKEPIVASDVIDNETTQEVDLGWDITGTTLSNFVNVVAPPILFQELGAGYVLIQVLNDGLHQTYLFKGAGGLYGAGELQTSDSDFQLIDSEAVALTKTSQLINDGEGGGFEHRFVQENELAPVALTNMYTDLSSLPQFNIEVVTGTTYTLQVSDYSSITKKRKIFTNGSPIDLIIPTYATAPFPISGIFEYTQKGDGRITEVPASGVTIISNLSSKTVKGETRRLVKTGTNEWTVEGSVDITSIMPSETLYKSWFSYAVSHLNGVFYSLNGYPISTYGTASHVEASGTSIYNSYPFLNYASGTGAGSNAGVKQDLNADLYMRDGFDAYFIFGNNDSNINCQTLVGSYGLAAAIPNLAVADFLTEFFGVSNDVGDANLSFYCKRTFNSPDAASYVKIGLGAGFPQNTTADIYMLRMEAPNTNIETERYIRLTIVNLITKVSATHTFPYNEAPKLNRPFLSVLHRSNRNTGVSTNIRFNKITVIRKLY